MRLGVRRQGLGHLAALPANGHDFSRAASDGRTFFGALAPEALSGFSRFNNQSIVYFRHGAT